MHREFSELKAYQRLHRDHFPEALSLRTHRALSWLNKAEQSNEDEDAYFIFLWIAFNAAYANDIGKSITMTEKNKFDGFLKKLCDLDADKDIYNLVWKQFAQGIRQLLDNKYVFQPFWDFHNGEAGSDKWEDRFNLRKARANKALSRSDTAEILSIMFTSLYTLRNQLIHGGATWQGSVNREQVRIGGQVLSRFVPLLIELMMKNPNELWGDPSYPVVK